DRRHVRSPAFSGDGRQGHRKSRSCGVAHGLLFTLSLGKMNHNDKNRVLFVCIGNACRSPMGEAVSAKDAADVIESSSAGLYPMGTIPEMTQTTLERNGYSANRLRSKGLPEIVPADVDLVINLSGYE